MQRKLDFIVETRVFCKSKAENSAAVAEQHGSTSQESVSRIINATAPSTSSITSGSTGGGGKFMCNNCKKDFPTNTLLHLHSKIHIFERPYRCDACAVSFRTHGHLQKHKRSSGHFNKVNLT